MSIQEFEAKFKTKNDCYRFLSSECHTYLPDRRTVTIWFLRDLAAGKRRRLKRNEVKLIDVPQFEGLGKEDVLQWLDSRPTKVDVLRALPEEKREIERLPCG